MGSGNCALPAQFPDRSKNFPLVNSLLTNGNPSISPQGYIVWNVKLVISYSAEVKNAWFASFSPNTGTSHLTVSLPNHLWSSHVNNSLSYTLVGIWHPHTNARAGLKIKVVSKFWTAYCSLRTRFARTNQWIMKTIPWKWRFLLFFSTQRMNVKLTRQMGVTWAHIQQ